MRAAVILALAGSMLLSTAEAQASGPPCTAPGYHQFDFWIGDWDVFDFGGSVKQAHAKIERVQNGCGLREQYVGVDGSSGESLTMYDPATDLWRQSWVSNRGQIVMIEGKLADGAITLDGPQYGSAAPLLIDGIWRPDKGDVRETARRSADNGKTWQAWFDLSFRRAAGEGEK